MVFIGFYSKKTSVVTTSPLIALGEFYLRYPSRVESWPSEPTQIATLVSSLTPPPVPKHVLPRFRFVYS